MRFRARRPKKVTTELRPPSNTHPILVRVVGYGAPRECTSCGKLKFNNWVVLTDNDGFRPICDSCVEKGATNTKEKRVLKAMNQIAIEEARNPSS